MANHNQQTLESIRVIGGLLGSKVIQDARLYGLPGQQKQDYGIEPGLSFNDELGRYWVIARSRWREFQQLRQRQDIDHQVVTVNDWLLPMLSRVFDYDVDTYQQSQQIGEREFPISHHAWQGAVPMVLCSAAQELDKSDSCFGQEGRRRSPMGLAQEYLNANSSSLWALVSNGLVLRLLRDNPAMTRPAYIEVDFARLFEEDNYADFATLWLLLHSSRLKPRIQQPVQCWLEHWRERGHDEGERALDKLRYGVADALRQLGTGFLAHPANATLRQRLTEQTLSTDAYFQQVLRLVYRLLFLLTAEDRDIALLPAEHEGQDYRQARALYQAGYSVSLLRERARQRRHRDHHGDAWQLLGITFAGFANGQQLLAQPALGGLFANNQCRDLLDCELENRYLFGALFDLCYFEHQNVLVRINYRDMDTEEFGSVYESLLELIPQIHPDARWRFSFMGDAEDEAAASGHSRKLTGSYYTPDSLVQELIKSALEPVLAERLASNPHNPREALLGMTVCDPACGSGHFLLAAGRRLAAELAQIDAGADQATEAHYRHALRDVVRHCIYGVDLNPMAVELCKTGLWLESIEPGKPLSFLDAHVQCGNALVGILQPQQLERGIPEDAYKALTGDDKEACTRLKKINKAAGKKLAVSLRIISQAFNELEAMPEDTVEQIEAKRLAYQQTMASQSYQHDRLKEDLFTAAFFAPKNPQTEHQVPTNAHLRLAAEGQPVPEPVVELTFALAKTHRFLHWPLAFPQVFGESGAGGFDVLLGNPPWERIKLQEQEFFASRAPEIAAAKNAAARQRMIEALAHSLDSNQQQLYRRFMEARQGTEGSSAFARLSGRFPLAGRGDVNLYALFAEHFAKSVGPNGRSGVIVPTGIATDDSTKFFFAWLAEQGRLISLYDFENRDALFNGVHRSYKFCLLTTGMNAKAADLSFFSTQTVHLTDPRRHFSLTPEEFALINPNTRTCPVFRSQKDAEITKKLYRSAPVLIREAEDNRPEVSPWGVRFSRLFDMSNDSNLFRTVDELDQVEGKYLRLYEAKLVHQYDHRWATYESDGETSRDCTLAEKHDRAYQVLPRYWVPEHEVTLRTAIAPKSVLDACKKADHDALERALRAWSAGALIGQGDRTQAAEVLGALHHADAGDLFAGVVSSEVLEAEGLQLDYPLEMHELDRALSALSLCEELWPLVWSLLEARRPRYLINWRRNCRSNDERTLISAILPLGGIGDSLFTMNVEAGFGPKQVAALYGQMNSLPFDFICRQKVGGVNFSFYYMTQLPFISPHQYTDLDLNFISHRVLELVYTAYDIKPFADDLGYNGEPFPFDPERRHQLRCELDAYYARLYGLTREELRYILDPTDVMGENYPSETFRVLKNKELNEFGEYRTQRVVLEAWDKLEQGELH